MIGTANIKERQSILEHLSEPFGDVDLRSVVCKLGCEHERDWQRMTLLTTNILTTFKQVDSEKLIR